MADQGKKRPPISKRLITLLSRVAGVMKETDSGTCEEITTRTDEDKRPPMPKRLITLLSAMLALGMLACTS